MATRLLDPADKVPSFCPEQELTPEESEFGSPVGSGQWAAAVRGPPAPARSGLVDPLGRGPAFCPRFPHPCGGSWGSGVVGACWEAVLETDP